MKTTQEALQEISGIKGTQQECLNALAFNSSPNGTPLTPITVKGGVVRVIDSAVGDIARTTSGWTEDEKYGIYFTLDAANASAEFDSAITRTGRLTAKITTSSATGKGRFVIGSGSGTGSSLSATNLGRWGIVIKPSTQYKLSLAIKYNNLVSAGGVISLHEHNISGSRLAVNAITVISGNSDWVLKTITFTSNASSNYAVITFGAPAAGDAQEFWADINSMTLEEVSTITNSSSAPALLYPKVTAVTSNDNIDQSQVVSDGTRPLGTASLPWQGQSFTPTKKNLTGFVIRRGTDTGTYTGNVTISIQADSAGSPSGTDLGAPITILNEAWGAITADTDYTVTYPLALTIGRIYWIVIKSSTADVSNYTRTRIQNTAGYAGGVMKDYNGSAWSSAVANELYFKTLYSKNTTNFTVSTDTQTISVTAPTPDGWADGTVIDTAGLGVTPLTLAPGVNNVYYSSNGADTADGTVDSSLQMTVGGSYGSLGINGLLTRQEACNYWAGTTGLSYQDAMNAKALTTKKTIQEAVNTYLESL